MNNPKPAIAAPTDIITHLLACMAEEGGEVGKECMKSIRFGLEDQVTLNPKGPRGTSGPTNRQKIVAELNDVMAVAALLIQFDIIPEEWQDHDAQTRKAAKVLAYATYGESVGALSMDRWPAGAPAAPELAKLTWVPSTLLIMCMAITSFLLGLVAHHQHDLARPPLEVEIAPGKWVNANWVVGIEADDGGTVQPGQHWVRIRMADRFTQIIDCASAEEATDLADRISREVTAAKR